MSFWSWFKSWWKSLQAKARYLFGVWLLGLLLLGLPVPWSDFLGITTLRESFRGYIGFVTLAAFVFWVIALIPFVERRLARRRILQNLRSLSDGEKRILAYCLLHDQRTIAREVGDPSAVALCNKGLLSQAGGLIDMAKIPFTIPMFVWVRLQQDKSVLGNVEELARQLVQAERSRW